MMIHNTFPLRAALIGTLLALVTPADAQNALGTGRALDRPLRVGDTVNNPVRDFDAELRFRNAIVTGNAPGGIAFRGDVGYVAEGEFFGSLGSDDTFQFRRDSLYSGLGGLGIRGTEALQFQTALSTGAPSANPYTNDLRVARLGYRERGTEYRNPNVTNVPGSVAATGFPNLNRIDPTDPDFDDRGMSLWTVRSAAAYAATQSFRPSLLGATEDEEGNVTAVEASPLRGIRDIPYNVDQKVEPEAQQQPLDLSVKSNEPTVLEESEEPDDEATDDQRTFDPGSYEGLLDRLNRFAPDPLPGAPEEKEEGEEEDPAAERRPADRTPAPDWRARLMELRRKLMPGLEEDPLADVRLREPEEEPEDEKGEEGEEDDPDREREPLLNEETLQMLRDAAGRIAELAPRDATGSNVYRRHMRVGERLIADRRYFDAEARFARAVAIRPHDAMAAAGRVHAQLGGGLFLSASLNLRTLLLSHPEIVTSRFDPALLPEPARLRTIKGELRQDIRGRQRLGVSAGLLLAYLGYQTEDAAAVREGLKLLPEPESLSENASREAVQNARLGELLRAVWLPAPDDDDTD